MFASVSIYHRAPFPDHPPPPYSSHPLASAPRPQVGAADERCQDLLVRATAAAELARAAAAAAQPPQPPPAAALTPEALARVREAVLARWQRQRSYRLDYCNLYRFVRPEDIAGSYTQAGGRAVAVRSMFHPHTAASGGSRPRTACSGHVHAHVLRNLFLARTPPA